MCEMPFLEIQYAPDALCLYSPTEYKGVDVLCVERRPSELDHEHGRAYGNVVQFARETIWELLFVLYEWRH
jgi:hypothetical protein